jgi:hypothetical protein
MAIGDGIEAAAERMRYLHAWRAALDEYRRWCGMTPRSLSARLLLRHGFRWEIPCVDPAWTDIHRRNHGRCASHFPESPYGHRLVQVAWIATPDIIFDFGKHIYQGGLLSCD